MPGGNQMNRPVLADQVKDYLLERIMDGTFPPSSRIIETSIAKAIGVSQAPVREALRALEAVGLVQIEPYRGARVHLPSHEDMRDANLIRAAVETLAITTAPLGEPVPAALEQAHHDMVQMAAIGDAHGFAEADVRFHSAIIGLPANRALTRVWQSLEPLTRTYMTTSLPDFGLTWAAGLHTPILEALNAGTREAAIRAMNAHFEEINKRIVGSEEPPSTTVRTVA